MFDDEPPELDFVSDNNSNKKNSTNLFVESEDDDDFVRKKISIQPNKKVNLFDEGEFYSYIQKNIKDKPESIPVKSNNIFEDVPDVDSTILKKENPNQKKISNLFSEEVEDDLFDSIIKKNVKPLNEEKSVPVVEEIMVKKRVYVCGEDDNTIVKKIPTIRQISNIFDDPSPEKDFDIFRTNNCVKFDEKKTNLFEDLSDEDSINKSSEVEVPRSNMFAQKLHQDHIFANRITKPSKSLAKLEQEIENDIIPSTSKLESHFSKESSETHDSDIFSNITKKSDKSKLESLFSDELSEEDIFTKKTNSKNSLAKFKKEIEQEIIPSTSKLESLFSNEPPHDDDIFSTKSSINILPTSSKIAKLFNDQPSEDENDLYSSKINKSEKPMEKSKSRPESLFKDEISDSVKEIVISDNLIEEQQLNEEIVSSKIEDLFNAQPPIFNNFIEEPNIDKEFVSSKFEGLFNDKTPEEGIFTCTANSPLSKSNKTNNLFSFSSKVFDEELSNLQLEDDSNNYKKSDKYIIDKLETNPSKKDVEKIKIDEPVINVKGKENPHPINVIHVEPKTPIISSQSGFLNEEPPPDLEQESGGSTNFTYSVPVNNVQLPIIEEIESVKPIRNQSALNYPSILFDDLPPPDDDNNDNNIFNNEDDVTALPYTKTSHVYYDDTDLFLTAQNSVMISPNLDLLNEEPPPVDNYQQMDEIDFKDKLNLFSTPEDKLHKKNITDVPQISVSYLIQARMETKPIESLKNLIQPNKLLNTNMAINVAALLPGAKRPSLKLALVNDERNSPDGYAPNIENETPKLNAPVESLASSNHPDILQSLSKGRVKIQVKRRPSTRQKRQENYRKSVNINNEDANNLDLDKTEDTSDEIDSNKNKLSTKFIDAITTPKSSHVDDESLIFKKVDIQKRESSLLLKKDRENNVPIHELKSEKNTLFSSDDDDDDLLFGPSVSKKSEKLVKVISSKSKNVPTNKPILKIENFNKKNENNIFGNDDDDDDLFGNTTRQKTKSVKTIDRNKNNLFGDSDDDDEDIFSVKKPKGIQ